MKTELNSGLNRSTLIAESEDDAKALNTTPSEDLKKQYNIPNEHTLYVNYKGFLGMANYSQPAVYKGPNI